MKARALSLLLQCGLSLALASPASAQPVNSTFYNAAMPPYRVLALMRATGFEPVGLPVRIGDVYRMRALDPNNIEYLLILDARTGRTVSVREIGMPAPYAAMPAYGPYRGPVYGRVFAPPADDYGYASPRPPREVPHAQPQPKPSKTAQAPLPRPRPYVMEATGSIPADAPKAPAPQKTPTPQKAPDPPQDNGGAAMPPVAPLD